jgi:PqqD family protein of HPr-rel-A system
MPTPGCTIWKRADAGALEQRWWDDQLVVYHRGSGNTHLLNLLAGEVLDCLGQSPAGAAELAGRVAGRLDLQPDPDFLQRMEALLNELEELGIVEAVLP